MTNEENFISKLEAFLDTKFDDYGRRRVEMHLKEYRDEIPPVIAYKERVVIKYRDAVKCSPELDRPVLTYEIMVDYAKYLCNEYGIDYDEFVRPRSGKSRGIIADIRRIYSRYLVSNYQHKRKQLQDFFEIDHSTVASYINTDKISPTIDTNKVHEIVIH